MIQPIQIFVVDDHPVVREGLIAVLETQAEFSIIGEASNGAEALPQLLEKAPDILFLDLAMPEMDGVQLIEALQSNGSSTKVIIFTIFDTDERIMSAIKAGAKGYLLKGASRKEIFDAVRIVHAGGSLLQPAVADKLFQHISQDITPLTPRELEVLKALSKGSKNSEIATALFISERTVKFHVSAILSKLNAQNRTEAVQTGIKRGLIDLS
ncbi:MAG: response regulator transcription factor [Saprospiraceae bacterium]|nr:response regulator transcription factor [Saprospiraceae bacterium]